MKKRYLWSLILGVVGAYTSSKGEALFSEAVLLGLFGGTIVGFMLGFLLEKREKSSL